MLSIPMDRSFLAALQYVMYFRFMDNVMFSYNGPYDMGSGVL